MSIENYQRLFNAIASTNGTALQSEMDEIISIVHKDFPIPSPVEDVQRMAEALKKIAQMSDPGSPERAVVDMKRIASDALAALSASTPPAKDNWVKIKPHFKEECVFITRSTYTRNNEPLQYDYTIWQTKWLMGEDEAGGDAFYLALLTGDGEEWGDLNDLEADEYLILFTLPTPPTT